ncbi:MAG: CPBP family intramembrane metalloprotease [Candidatus Omnitrophica bacterium]|nr:CPBP family intramembrane metalloprotease [Candidatus Omnitrophota bacterium]
MKKNNYFIKIITLTIILALSIWAWMRFSYPQMALIDLKIDRQQALNTAEKYLKEQNIDVNSFKHGIVFGRVGLPSQYLQKTLGFKKMTAFINQNHFQMFYWSIRFFKENQKEEFRFSISSADGQILDFQHVIADTDQRPNVTQEDARAVAEKFLHEKFNFDPAAYIAKEIQNKKLDHRNDYTFSWQRKDINIPWTEKTNSGTAKLISNVKISGKDILEFSWQILEIPDDFKRDLKTQEEVGQNIILVVSTLLFILSLYAIYFLVLKLNNIAIIQAKPFFIYLSVFLMILFLASIFNSLQNLIYNYPTTAKFISYINRSLATSILGIIILVVALIIPGISGELLNRELTPENIKGGLLYKINSTFFNRSISYEILIGYALCIILLGLQSILINVGQTHWGVWLEYNWLTQSSTNYWPVLASFTLAIRASLSEEFLFRSFAINLGKKYFKNIVIPVILSAALWGFAHSSYPVYPMWFRGIEVTIMGFILGFCYLRYGLLTVIIAHYLFDAFWGSSPFLFSKSITMNSILTFVILCLPALWALIALLVNQPNTEKNKTYELNKKQEFNKEILLAYLKQNPDLAKSNSNEKLIQQITNNGWDVIVVEETLRQYLSQNNSQNQ